MSLMQVNWHPTDKEIRNFGIIAIIASTIIAVVFYIFKGLALKWAGGIGVIGFGIFLCCLTWPTAGKFIYLGLTLVTLPIGWVVSVILMASFYFLVITPLGLFFRLTGRDILCRKFDSNAKSYWLARKPADSMERYFRQF